MLQIRFTDALIRKCPYILLQCNSAIIWNFRLAFPPKQTKVWSFPKTWKNNIFFFFMTLWLQRKILEHTGETLLYPLVSIDKQQLSQANELQNVNSTITWLNLTGTWEGEKGAHVTFSFNKKSWNVLSEKESKMMMKIMWFEKKIKNDRTEIVQVTARHLGLSDCPVILNHRWLWNERNSEGLSHASLLLLTELEKEN